jgi:hypothetical protein
MSWETFKQNILRVANNPDGIPDIEIIADLYAKEYDAAIKRGFDTVNGTKVRSGDVVSMKQFFLSALQKGLTSQEPYDLVGEMGAGVKAYWATVILGNEVIPAIPAPGSVSNVSVTSNTATYSGDWQRPTAGATGVKLTPEQRVEFQEQLERAVQRYDEFNAAGKVLEATTCIDEINKFTGILELDENARVDVPSTPTFTNNQPALQVNRANPSPQSIGDDNIGEIDDDGGNSGEYFEEVIDTPNDGIYTPPQNPATNPNTGTGGVTNISDKSLDDDSSKVIGQDDNFTIGSFNQGKPFVTGFRAGIGGGFTGGGSLAPYVPFNAFTGNMTVGEKAVAIAVHDASQGIKEIGEDTGHARIVQMQKVGAGGGTGFPWCGCAVATWWTEAGGGSILSTHPNPAYVPTWTSWSIANGRYVDMRNPQNANFVPKPGDAIIYDNGLPGVSNHIGIFWKIEGGLWYGVDGNFGRAIKTHKLVNLNQVQAVVRI